MNSIDSLEDPIDDFAMAEAQSEYFALFQELVERRRERLAEGHLARLASPGVGIRRDDDEALASSIAMALQGPPDIEAIRANSEALRAMIAERG